MEMRDDKRLLIKVCKMYYEEDMTQSQIAKATGIYRTTVGRMLKKAREAGIVKITIDDHVGTHYDLERELEQEVRDRGSISKFYLEKHKTKKLRK